MVVSAILSVKSAAAENVTEPDAPVREVAPLTPLLTEGTKLAIPGRAPRINLLLSTRGLALAGSVGGGVGRDVLTSGRPAYEIRRDDALARVNEIRIGAIGISAKGRGGAGKREILDCRCDAALQRCSNDGRNATASALAQTALNPLGWLLGALGIVGTGAYLLVTSDRGSGTQTNIQTDFFKKGIGLRVRREW